MKRRILSIITALALCLSLCPTWAFATEADPSLCKHHPAHTADCGYAAPTEGHDCGHEHTEDCYTTDEAGGKVLDCQHSHNSECGYVQADPGTPCGYVCRICPIEDLIAALPEQVTEDNADDVRAQLDKILALYRELDEGEQEEIDLSRCYELQEALDNANAPMQAAGEINISQNRQNILTEEDGGCQGHTFTGTAQATMIYVESGVHDVTFANLNITAAAKVGVAPGATMNLTIRERNTISAGGNYAGIYVPKDATLVITNGSTGTLEVSSPADAGIGGAWTAPDNTNGDVDCGTVVINGGTITAAGGGSNSVSAGIGGSGGDDTPGNGGTVIINGGTVTATGGSESAGYYGGAGIGGSSNGESGNGGTLTISGGHVTLAPGAHNTQWGTAYGFGRGSCTPNASTGTCELTLADASYLDSGTTLDPKGKYTINGDPTADMIVVPEDLIYSGKAQELAGRIYIDDSKTGTGTYFGQTFTVNASADGWVLQDLGEVVEAKEYTATFTKGDQSISKKFTVAKSGTQFVEDGEVKTYNGETQTDTFTAGDTITVKATPTPTGKAPDNSAMFAASFTAPGAGQMAVFVNGVQVSEPADAGADGVYTMTVRAADVLLAANGPGTGITLTAKFVENNNMADGTGTATVNITAAAKAERGGTLLGYYDESGLNAALAYKNNEGAVFTLLKDVTYEEREQGLEIKITCTLDLGGHTIRSKGEYAAALSTYVNTTVTIRGEGTVISEQGHGFSVGGTATPEGGTFISGTADYNGVYVRTGKLIVTSEAVVIENTGGGIGLGVNSGTGATAQLSAGTYEGGAAAIEIYQGTGTLAGLLNQEGASRVAYYKDNTTLVTEGLDGKTLPSGSYTVKACTHTGEGVCTYTHNENTSTHTKTCLACGKTWDAEDCDYGEYTHNDTGHTRICKLCEYQNVEAHNIKCTAEASGTVIAVSEACKTCGYGKDLGTVTIHIPKLVYGDLTGVVTAETTLTETVVVAVVVDNNLSGSTTIFPLEPPTMATLTGNALLSAGTHQIKIEIIIIRDENALAECELTFNVAPAPLTPSITGTATKPYDGTTDVASGQLSITLTGVVGSDDVTAVATSYAYDNTNAGENKTITASGITLKGDSKDNYTLSSTTATTTGTITKSQPTIVFASGYNPGKTYDGQTISNPTADDLTITGANFSDVTFEWSATPKDAGTYTLTANIPETDNTAAASTSPLTVTISKAPLTVTGATVASKPYDGTDTAIVTGVTFTGLVNGETLALGTDYTATGKFDSASAGTGKSVTVTVTLADTAKANNYDLTPNTTTATSTITKASSTITTAPTATGITYGQALSDSALTGGGAVSGDTTIAGTWNWTAPDTKPNAGTAQYEVTFMPTDTNYDTATVNVTVTVAKATPTLTAPAAGAIQYGQKLSNSTLTGGTATNPNDSATVAGSWSWASGNTRPTADGDFPVAFVPSDTANYNAPGNVDASVTVTPAAPKITLAVPAYQVANGVVEVKYTAANPHDATLNDLPAVTLTYKVGSGAEQPITDGKFTIPEGTAVDTVITVTASTAAVDGKYTAATKTATVTVTDKIPVEISGVGVTGRAYNGKAINHTGTPVIKTLDSKTVTDATVTYTWSSGGDTGPINAGNYTLTISVDGEKYIGSTTVDFTIEKATVTITAVNKSAVVGSAQPELTYTVSGLADGETLTTAPTLTCTPDMNTVGSYPITASGAAVSNTGNYNTTITYVDGTLSVTAKPSTGGGGYVPSNPGGSTITVPVSGDKSTVRVSASVSGTTATVSKIDTTQIENVIGDNGQASMVEIDFTGLGKTIDTVKLPAAAIKDIAAKAQNEEVGGLTVKLPEAEISFDANALSAIQAQAGSQITLTVTPAKPADLNSRQKEAVGNAPVFNLTLRSSSGAITDFRGGYATVSLPYTLAAGQNPSGVVVYYLDSTGNITPCPTMYDVRSKSAIFTTGHLSLYFVGYDPAAVWVNPFSDVAGDAWYYDAVRYASENGLMGGYGNGMFGPNDNLSRAQFAQILFNKGGRPVVNYLLRYNDVADGAWYTEAVRWATSQGVVSGYGNGMFGPNDIITREQLAVMLWRYAGSPAATDKELHFTDADQASGFALEALRWAVENSIINGKSGGILDPQGLATRAEAAQILKNFLGK